MNLAELQHDPQEKQSTDKPDLCDDVASLFAAAVNHQELYLRLAEAQ